MTTFETENMVTYVEDMRISFRRAGLLHDYPTQDAIVDDAMSRGLEGFAAELEKERL